jgi:hypothetical protein
MTVEQRPSLYELLPAVQRVRDAAEGFPLRGLVAVVEEQVEALEADIDRLYDNWFIETCDEWLVPYVGDLVGVQGLLPVEGAGFSQRGLVADTIALRRAKGTAAVLEQLARDVTGWPAKAVEYFDLLAATRAMNHQRRSDVAFADVRDAARAELAGTPFERVAHTGEVRHIDDARGRYNIANVGIHLWRLQAYDIAGVTAHAVEPGARYTFDPLGGDIPLFNVPRAERALTELAAELNVPGRLRRRPLHDELEALRSRLALGATADVPDLRYFDDRQPVLGVTLLTQAGGAGPVRRTDVPPEEIAVCNLADPPPGIPPRRPPADLMVGVDPVLGRLALPAGPHPDVVGVEVRYAYGFAGDLGGGPYDRSESVAEALAGLPPDHSLRRQWGVTRDLEVTGPGIVRSLRDAVTAWNAEPPGRFGVIAVMDSRTYEEDLTIDVPAGSTLVLVAGGWPIDEAPDELDRVRRRGRVTPNGRRPHLRGRLSVRGTAGARGATRAGDLIVDGLLIEHDVTVEPGDLGLLRLAHCTIVPGRAKLLTKADTAGGENSRLRVVLHRTISGPVTVDGRAHSLLVEEGIVDGLGGAAIAAPALEAARSTVLGTTLASSVEASESIFTGLVEAERRQQGCVRYSYLPFESRVARRFRCQPESAAAADAVAPAFGSTRYGDPDYGRLARRCPPELARGAENDGEMGAFGFLEQPRRIANLTTRLDEYLRFGLEAGVFFVT